MKPTDQNVDAFLETDLELAQIDQFIRDALPTLNRVLWQGVFWGGTEQSIIGYGRITQPRPRGESVEWFLIGLARQKKHISLYVSAVENNQYLIHAYKNQLGSVKLGAAVISFTDFQKVNQIELRSLLQHALRISVVENSPG